MTADEPGGSRDEGMRRLVMRHRVREPSRATAWLGWCRGLRRGLRQRLRPPRPRGRPRAGVRRDPAGRPGAATADQVPPAPRTVMGIEFLHAFGLAAGFDKNAKAVPGPGLGFGHVEIGTVTARPQPGNPEAAAVSPARRPCRGQPDGVQQRRCSGRRRPPPPAPSHPHRAGSRHRRQHRQDEGHAGRAGGGRLRRERTATGSRSPATWSSTCRARTRRACAICRPSTNCVRSCPRSRRSRMHRADGAVRTAAAAASHSSSRSPRPRRRRRRRWWPTWRSNSASTASARPTRPSSARVCWPPRPKRWTRRSRAGLGPGPAGTVDRRAGATGERPGEELALDGCRRPHDSRRRAG